MDPGRAVILTSAPGDYLGLRGATSRTAGSDSETLGFEAFGTCDRIAEEKKIMSTDKVYEGRCFCGAVELRVVGKPAAMGYCHCTSCRQWSAGPVNAFTLWPPSAVTITRGAELLGSYSKTPNSIRKWCKACGGHLLTEHPRFELTDVYAAVLREFPFEPMLHVNYGETVLRMHDGLPKQRDFPKELGGSGTSVPE